MSAYEINNRRQAMCKLCIFIEILVMLFQASIHQFPTDPGMMVPFISCFVVFVPCVIYPVMLWFEAKFGLFSAKGKTPKHG